MSTRLSPDSSVSSVQRAFDLMRSFRVDEPELSVTELSLRLRVPKSTVSRLLSTLQKNRIVDRNPDNGKFRLGIGVLELAGSVMLHADLRQTARPFLRQLSELTQETVNLAVLETGESVNIEQAVSYERHVTGIGCEGKRQQMWRSLFHPSNQETRMPFFKSMRGGMIFSGQRVSIHPAGQLIPQ